MASRQGRDYASLRALRDKVEANRCVWCDEPVPSAKRRQCPPCAARGMGPVPENLAQAVGCVVATRRAAELAERQLLKLAGWRLLDNGTLYWEMPTHDGCREQSAAVAQVLAEHRKKMGEEVRKRMEVGRDDSQ